MDLDEVQLINVLQRNLSIQNGIPIPPQVNHNMLAARANKPDYTWVVNEVASSQIRLPLTLTAQGILLQRGTLQQIDPVTGVAQEVRDPVQLDGAQMAARSMATAQTRVSEIFRTLTRDEQPTMAGQPAHAVRRDIRTFTLYVHYYLARQTIYNPAALNWQISRANT